MHLALAAGARLLGLADARGALQARQRLAVLPEADVARAQRQQRIGHVQTLGIGLALQDLERLARRLQRLAEATETVEDLGVVRKRYRRLRVIAAPASPA